MHVYSGLTAVVAAAAGGSRLNDSLNTGLRDWPGDLGQGHSSGQAEGAIQILHRSADLPGDDRWQVIQ